jgi:DNA-binding transcriptional MerR regulator
VIVGVTPCLTCGSQILSERLWCVSCRDRGRAGGWSAHQAADLAGCSYRQLDYWARTDLIRPSLNDAHGSGSRRRYSYPDVARLCLVTSLTRGGIKLESLRGNLPDPGVNLSHGYLVITERAMVHVTEEALRDVLHPLTEHYRGVYQVICLGPEANRLDDRIRRLGLLGIESEDAPMQERPPYAHRN